MRSRIWVILVVIAAVVAVVLAKRATRSSSPPQHETIARASDVPAESASTPSGPAEEGPLQAAVEPVRAEPIEATPQPKAVTKPQRNHQPEPTQAAELRSPPSESVESASQEAEAEPAEEAADAAPEPVEPLPGSSLTECLQNGRPTMVDFGAGWCRPCKEMEPVVTDAATKYTGKADIVFVDTDKYSSIARRYGIRLIPTQIFFDAEGKEVFRNSGVLPLHKIDEQFTRLGIQK
jgi:thioredoxin 1